MEYRPLDYRSKMQAPSAGVFCAADQRQGVVGLAATRLVRHVGLMCRWLLLVLMGFAPVPVNAASFSDDFSSNPGSRFIEMAVGPTNYNAANDWLNCRTVLDGPSNPCWNPSWTIDADGAVLTVDVWRNNKAISAVFYLWDALGRTVQTTDLGITNAQTTYSRTINSTNFTGTPGFDFHNVRYVGVYFTSNSTTSRLGRVDNFSLVGFSYTPEPSTLLLGILAGLGYTWHRRGRQQRVIGSGQAAKPEAGLG